MQLLQALGLDESFYGYVKQFSNEQPIEYKDPPSDPHFRTTPAHNFITETTIYVRPALFFVTKIKSCDPTWNL